MSKEKKRVVLLFLIMVLTSMIVLLVSITMLYAVAIKEETSRLTETAISQARLIEAIARFDSKYNSDYPEGPFYATLSQVKDAHNRYDGFGETGEFTLSRRVGDQIEFLLNYRHGNRENPEPIPFDSHLAEPMRQALMGRSGTIIGLDYRGVKVLAAFEPVSELNLGIVAKIDLAEIRQPFINVMLVSVLVGLTVIVAGAFIFFRVTNPIIKKLVQNNRDLQDALNEVNRLSGLLPICAECKKIRDDRGYWNQIEMYLREHSEAEFSHGLCPDCVDKYLGELDDGGRE